VDKRLKHSSERLDAALNALRNADHVAPDTTLENRSLEMLGYAVAVCNGADAYAWNRALSAAEIAACHELRRAHDAALEQARQETIDYKALYESGMKEIERFKDERDRARKQLRSCQEFIDKLEDEHDVVLEQAREEAVDKARPRVIWETYNNVFDAIFPEDWRDHTSEPMTIDDVRREVTKRLEYELEKARGEERARLLEDLESKYGSHLDDARLAEGNGDYQAAYIFKLQAEGIWEAIKAIRETGKADDD